MQSVSRTGESFLYVTHPFGLCLHADCGTKYGVEGTMKAGQGIQRILKSPCCTYSWHPA